MAIHICKEKEKSKEKVRGKSMNETEQLQQNHSNGICRYFVVAFAERAPYPGCSITFVRFGNGFSNAFEHMPSWASDLADPTTFSLRSLCGNPSPISLQPKQKPCPSTLESRPIPCWSSDCKGLEKTPKQRDPNITHSAVKKNRSRNICTLCLHSPPSRILLQACLL